jgi:HSP20 family molecular chaperone IbpA
MVARQSACWEPPVDMLETAREVIVTTVLPGVDPASVSITVENGVLEIFGQRSPPPELSVATIHRLELPQGCFQRQLRIPPGAYDDIRRSAVNGCLVVTLRKYIGR